MSYFFPEAKTKIHALDLRDPPAAIAVMEKPKPQKPKEEPSLPKVMEIVSNPPSYDLTTLAAALADRTAALESLFEIEIAARVEVQKQIERIQRDHNVAATMAKYPGKYFPVSIDVLGWRTGDGLPKLALFSLSNSVFKISSGVASRTPYQSQQTTWHSDGRPSETRMVHAWMEHHVSPALPKPLMEMYDDVVRALCDRAANEPRSAWGRAECSIGAIFSGVIPDSTRAKIKEAQGVFKEIFILAEPEFTFETKMVPLSVDPIVLGWDGQQLWYVDDFDITPIEEAALLKGLQS